MPDANDFLLLVQCSVSPGRNPFTVHVRVRFSPSVPCIKPKLFIPCIFRSEIENILLIHNKATHYLSNIITCTLKKDVSVAVLNACSVILKKKL